MLRSEQAVAEQIDSELTIRAVGYDPNPWDVGAIAAILPDLCETPGIDWTKQLASWSREEMLSFLTAAFAPDDGSAEIAARLPDIASGGLLDRRVDPDADRRSRNVDAVEVEHGKTLFDD